MIKRFREFVHEMAAPTPEHHGMTFYHGVSDEAAAHKILKDGHLSAAAAKTTGGHLKPMQGHAYVTPHLHYAQIYAQGGDVAGSDHHRIKGEHGYVFGVSGKHLKDIHPDEDSVGEHAAQRGYYPKGHALHFMNHLADKHLTPHMKGRLDQGLYSEYARSGKKLVKHMNDEQKLALINHKPEKHSLSPTYTHIAHKGDLPVTHAWRIHKDKVKLLKRDGSNFFDHAEKVL